MDSEFDKQKDDIVAYSSYGKKSGRRKVIRTITVVLMATALIIVFMYFVVTHFFKIETLIVDGTDKYSFTDICTSADISKGDVIFTVSQKKIEDKLKNDFPFIKSIEVIKTYPSTVNIVIYEENPLFYVCFDDEYYVLTNELKVLERYTDLDRLKEAYPDLKVVKTTPIYKVIAPNKVQFTEDKDLKYVSSVLQQLSDWEGFEKIGSIDISNKFNIIVEFDERITVFFGNRYDFETKLRMATAMIGTYSQSAQGTINVKDIEEGIARITEPENDNQ